MKGKPHVWEFRSKDRGVVRYQLDPDNDMMPIRIENYQATEPLFLRDILEIGRYEKHDGCLFPAEATLYRGIGIHVSEFGSNPDTWDRIRGSGDRYTRRSDPVSMSP